jgi:hypothetical protein
MKKYTISELINRSRKFRTHFLLISIFLLVLSYQLSAQLVIVSAHVESFNVTPQSLCNVSIMNPGMDMKIVLESKIANNSGEMILKVRTSAILIKNGINNMSSLTFGLSSVEYGSSTQANYVKTMHILPCGYFNYCCRIVEYNAEVGDEYCEDIESTMNSFLNLVLPYDKDSIEQGNPLLVWTHSEPFNALAQGESFRLVLTELKKDQSAEVAVLNNIPLFFKEYLTAHQLQYPPDAAELEKGKSYAWQVQKISKGNMIDKTEAWSFVVKPDYVVKDNKYATLKKTLDASYYIAANNKIFFRFDEDYYSNSLNYNIYNGKHEKVKLVVKSDEKSKNAATVAIKIAGINRYMLDLSSTSLSSEIYTLEVINEKNEHFLLKFKTE